MDQLKIGKFIAEKRKEKNLTQAQLADKLGITDRAVSKWETGRSLPDAAIMLDLCGLLEITVNDLLSGEVISMVDYNEQTEKNLIAVLKEKEQTDKRLLKTEIVIMSIALAFLIAMIAIAALIEMQDWIRFLLIGVGLIQFLVAACFAVRIEQKAGYYECPACGHVYVPDYSKVLFAMHVNRKRYMKCPNCGKSSWQKEKISKG